LGRQRLGLLVETVRARERRHHRRLHRAALAECLADDLAEDIYAPEPLLGIAMTRARDELVDLLVRAGHDLAGPRATAFERRADQALVHQRADSEDIAGPRRGASLGELGRDRRPRGNEPGLDRGERSGSEREID